MSDNTIKVFSGHAGSGKLKEGMDIATSLNAPLLRVNLQTVTSKYIGETEKNLKKLFKAARLAGAVLYFDEADALFGKRTEVKDAHDRHANKQISYLLKRSERHPGVVIFATNDQHETDQVRLKRKPQAQKFSVGKSDSDAKR